MIKTRFAPSPTGFLHVGGARTALFNYLFARKFGGTFLLRIEDTDPERSKPEYSEQILISMKWLGLDWDEGPYHQSQRMDIYKSYTEQLLKEGKAYRCFCTQEELEEMREQQRKAGLPTRYDGRCSRLTQEEIKEKLDKGMPYAIRLKVPQDRGIIAWDDMVKGHIEINSSELDDFILVRSDGTPTYNFAVVIDDYTMGVTHVLRGEDHIPNTPKQILIYEALGWETPVFGHVPMILGKDKTKLSKRHGAVGVEAYRDEGYLPEALFNFLALLGASYDPDREVYTKQELIDLFDPKKIGLHAAVFDPDKLNYINREHMKMLPPEELLERIKPFAEAKGFKVEPFHIKLIPLLVDRMHTLKDFVEMADYIFTDDFSIDEKAQTILEKNMPLDGLSDELKAQPWDAEHIEQVLRAYAQDKGIKPRDYFPFVRAVISGKSVGPSLFHLMEAMPQEMVLRRLTARN
ncbi:glutamate--tRNA ligase [Coprothermobacter platensis]|uniref:glutamate--tRNA ligase n=1 Tax=Coprothermobacter platensis TaxID=108819 RepID=UPI000379F1FD|nr:glutamate--tRNA ligase [Coprothermobacter platensis]